MSTTAYLTYHKYLLLRKQKINSVTHQKNVISADFVVVAAERAINEDLVSICRSARWHLSWGR